MLLHQALLEKRQEHISSAVEDGSHFEEEQRDLADSGSSCDRSCRDGNSCDQSGRTQRSEAKSFPSARSKHAKRKYIRHERRSRPKARTASHERSNQPAAE